MASNHPPTPTRAAPATRVRPWASLAFPSYRLLWSASLLSTMGLQMRQFANVWQVYEMTGSPLKLGLTGLFQALPLFTIGLFAGTVTDAVDRRKLLIVSQAINLLLAMVLGLLTLSGRVEVWHIYAVTSLTSAVNVFGQPARVSLISATVPRTHLMNAITLNQVIQQSAQLVGPTLAGLVVAWAGPASAYFANATLFIPALAGLAALRVETPRPTGARGMRFSNVLEGLNFVRRTPVLVGLILLDTTATLFGSYRALMPVFAKDILHVGPAGLGTLLSAPALGAVLGTIGILSIGNVQRKGLMVLMSTSLYACALVFFGVSHWFGLSLALAGTLGLLDAMGVSVRQTTVQLRTPEHLRGRATSIQQIFAMGAPSLGYLLAGTMASAMGPRLTLFLAGGVIISVVGIIALANRELRSYRA